MALGFAPPEELSLVAFESDVCTTYLFSNFVWKSYGSLWLDQAAQGKLGALSLDAVKALAQLSFGLSNRVKDLQLKGVAQYGRCLRILAEELGKDGAAAHGNERLMVPILVLMMVSVSPLQEHDLWPDADFSRPYNKIEPQQPSILRQSGKY